MNGISSPPHPHPLGGLQSHRLHNSHLCRWILERKPCPKGTRCTFAHSTTEWRRLPDELRKARLCEYNEKGAKRCPFSAEKCNFAHGISELRSRVRDHFSVTGMPGSFQSLGQIQMNHSTQVMSPNGPTPSSILPGTSSCTTSLGSVFGDSDDHPFNPVRRNILHAGLVLAIIRTIHEHILSTKVFRGESPIIEENDTASVAAVMSKSLYSVPVRVDSKFSKRVDKAVVFQALGTRRVRRLLCDVPVIAIESTETPGGGSTPDAAAGEDARFVIRTDQAGWERFHEIYVEKFNRGQPDLGPLLSTREYAQLALKFLPVAMSNVMTENSPARTTMSLAWLLHDGRRRPAGSDGCAYIHKGESLKCEVCQRLLFEPLILGCGHIFCQRCVKRRPENQKCIICRVDLQPHPLIQLKVIDHDGRQPRPRPGTFPLSDEAVDRLSQLSKTIESTFVTCPIAKKRCKWEGRYGALIQHLTTHCGRIDTRSGANSSRQVHYDPIPTHEARACYAHSQRRFLEALRGIRRYLELYPRISPKETFISQNATDTARELVFDVRGSRTEDGFPKRAYAVLARGLVRSVAHLHEQEVLRLSPVCVQPSSTTIIPTIRRIDSKSSYYSMMGAAYPSLMTPMTSTTSDTAMIASSTTTDVCMRAPRPPQSMIIASSSHPRPLLSFDDNLLFSDIK